MPHLQILTVKTKEHSHLSEPRDFKILPKTNSLKGKAMYYLLQMSLCLCVLHLQTAILYNTFWF